VKYRIVTFLVFGTALFFLGEQSANEHHLPFTQSLDRVWLEFCIANTSDRLTDGSVTLVRIDDTYEPALPSDELTRLDYAVILANIEKFKPQSVAIAPSLQWPETNIINQKALKTQCSKMPLLTLGAVVENSPVPDKNSDSDQYSLLANIEGDTSQITPFTRTVAYPEADSRANGRAAFTEIELSNIEENSGTLTIPLIAKHGDNIVPSFILLAIINHTKHKLENVSVQLPPAVSRGEILIGEDYVIPIDKTGRMKIYEHAAIAPPLYRTVSATELPLALSEDPSIKALQIDLEDEYQSLSNNLIVIGLDRKSDRLLALSSGDKISLSELITRSIATIQSGRFIEQWPLPGRLIGFAGIIVAALRLYQFSRWKVLIWGGLLTFLYIGGSVFVFKSSLLWTPLFTPLALFATLILIGIILPHVPSNKTTSAALESDGTSKDLS